MSSMGVYWHICEEHECLKGNLTQLCADCKVYTCIHCMLYSAPGGSGVAGGSGEGAHL